VQAEVTCAKPETAAGLECHRPSLELCQVRWKKAAHTDPWHEGQPVGVNEQRPLLYVDGANLAFSGAKPRDSLIFSVRARDGEGGAWSVWSTPTAPVLLGLPPLAPPVREQPGVNLQARATDADAAHLTWPAFVTPDVEPVPIEYRIEARCGAETEIVGFVCKPGVQRLSYDAPVYGPTQFLVSARWKALESLAAEEWSAPIVSSVVAGKSFLPPSTPIVLVTASDSAGLCAVAEWRSETNSKAFQLRYLDETWHTCPPVLSGESRARLPNELPLGRRYSVAVRVGDGVRRWSEWSAPRAARAQRKARAAVAVLPRR
jgi:hypothetical protein